MDIYSLLGLIVIGLIAGWLAGQITKGRGLGLVGNLVVGIIGAFIGTFLFGLLGFGVIGMLGSLIAATCGAVVLLLVVNFIGKF